MLLRLKPQRVQLKASAASLPGLARRASSRAARSPRVREFMPKASTPGSRLLDTIEWPKVALEDAYKDGLIPLPSTRSVALLNELFRTKDGLVTEMEARKLLAGKYPAGNVLIIADQISEYDIQPRTIFWMAWIAQHHTSNSAVIMSAARTLQALAATLGDTHASLVLLESALRANKPSSPEMPVVLENLMKAAKAGNYHAQERLAALAAMKHEDDLASATLRGIIDKHYERDIEEASILDPQFSAWRTLASIQRAQEDEVGELLSIQHGMSFDDDADAYCELATKDDSLTQQTRHEYLLKAASSGVGRAQLLVGEYYYHKSSGRALHDALAESTASSLSQMNDRKTASDPFQLRVASEWLQAASEARKGPLGFDRMFAAAGAIMTLAELGEPAQALALLQGKYSDMHLERHFNF